jgi:hypothetical protein
MFQAEGTVRADKISLTMSGYLWGEDEESWLITYSGLATG